MDVSKLSDVEYKYLFDIDELREAYKLSDERNETVQKSPYFTDESKKKINEISTDFDCMINNIIERQNIKSFEDYKNALDALTLADAGIQIAICESTREKQFGKFKKSHSLYKDFLKWKHVQIHIGSKEWSYLFTQGHRTAISYIALWICALFIFLICLLSRNIIAVLCGITIFFMAILALVGFSMAFDTRLGREYYIDQLHRIKNYTLFKSKDVLKSKNASIFRLLSMIHK